MICGKCGQEASGLYPKWVISGWNGKIYEPYYYWAHSSQFTGADGKRHTKLTWHYMGKWSKYYEYYREEDRNYRRWQRENREQYRKYEREARNISIEAAFKIIGINANTSPEDAKKAFRKAVFLFHPDREPDINKQAEANAKMQQVNAAWEVIGNYYKSRGL